MSRRRAEVGRIRDTASGYGRPMGERVGSEG